MTDQGMRAARPAAAARWASRTDTGNCALRTIVAAAALAAGASQGETAAGMTETMATTFAVYWRAYICPATMRGIPPAG